MCKDILKKQVTCEIVTVSLEGHEKKCNKIYSLSTSITHLNEHLNTKHQIFPSNQYKKNSKGQTIIEMDNSIQTIPLIFSKMDSHKPEKQQCLQFRLAAWIIEDCQSLVVMEEQKFREFCYEMDPRFKVPGPALVKTTIQKSVLFAKNKLHDLISNPMETFSFTPDMWTGMHHPYIGVTIHWLSKNFDLNQAVLTIEEFPYPHTGEQTTDNDKSIVKGMQLLAVPHIHCTAHTIQLAIKDGLNACKDLLIKAKELNNWLPLLGDEDSELDLFELVQQNFSIETTLNFYPNINTRQTEKQSNIVEPIRDVKTRWNSTYFVLKSLTQLRDATEQLAKSLYQQPELPQKKDGQTTKLIGGAQYPTLGMMLPTISCLFTHLDQMKTSLISSNILDVCYKIEDSMFACWETPLIEAYIASYLDP
ncbi:13049_t:CDS:2 [Cetraspora pellucida]|uniref:13049_t:CDS:1 n=1 Tax=Cetraspora pellucida TaxID=1433469 RepID=A0A9N9EGP6_9GLOM|nr:13049_t:CDS:2 [Cetraspora pellucida]